MTATPKAGDAADGYSMDDPSLFGPVAHTVSFGEAIASGLLTDYQVLVVAGAENATDPSVRVPTVFAKAVDSHGLRRVLTFHGRVAKAEAFAAALDGVTTPAGTRIHARHVNGKMSTKERTDALQWSGASESSEVRLVSNARCLSEGVDVPAVGAVMFADKRSSVVEIVQAVGRVLRPAPGKRIGTILLPLGLDEADDDSSLSLSRYSEVWTVLRGLRAHDQRLASELDAAARAFGRQPGRKRGGGYRLARVEFVVPADVDVDALQLRAVREVGGLWDRNRGLLQAWAQGHAGKLIPRATKVDCAGQTVNLGEWCEQQRQMRRRGLLSEVRTDLLEQVPGWAWDKADGWWRRTFQQLVDHAAAHGTVADRHEGVSVFAGIKSKAYPRRPIGVWMAEQRQAYRLGTLPQDRVAGLESLRGWSWDGGLPETDVDHVEALRQFVEFEKHAKVRAQPGECAGCVADDRKARCRRDRRMGSFARRRGRGA